MVSYLIFRIYPPTLNIVKRGRERKRDRQTEAAKLRKAKAGGGGGRNRKTANDESLNRKSTKKGKTREMEI